MKNSQKGFLIPLLIIVIAVLAIGGGVYYYSQNGSSDDFSSNGITVQYPSGWKKITYTNQPPMGGTSVFGISHPNSGSSSGTFEITSENMVGNINADDFINRNISVQANNPVSSKITISGKPAYEIDGTSQAQWTAGSKQGTTIDRTDITVWVNDITKVYKVEYHDNTDYYLGHKDQIKQMIDSISIK